MTAAAPLPLSVFIIAKDEADRIGGTIQAVRTSATTSWSSIRSTDATQAVAAGLGARVIHHPWPGYGPQKRFAEEQCRHDWILNVDADEVVPEELAREIRALFAAAAPAPAYRIEIAEIFPGEGRPHRFAYTLTPVRLYRRDKGRYRRRWCMTGSSWSPAAPGICAAPSITSRCARSATRSTS